MATILTPYDTGDRAEPKLWQTTRADVEAAVTHGEPEDVGNVDFDDDESTTVATVHVSRDPDGGHTVHVIPHADTIRLDLHTEQ
ncbi:hypothetical protein ACT3TZ_13885 [Brachybacterium sp. AOP25-B2-12]|uniref:hypothetical protein n=1 Tax=Brachybacterium sp. AOP25-B2-12 TaxID=3457710 RepID=UPI004034B956